MIKKNFMNKKRFAALLLIFMFLCPLFKVKAAVINEEIDDIYRKWNIEFNLEISLDDETKKAIKVVDENGKTVDVTITSKDGKTLTIVSPKEGYKRGKTYTINIEKGVHTKDSVYLGAASKYVFKVKDDINTYKYKTDVEKSITAGANKIIKKGIETDWEAIAVHKSGLKVPEAYVNTIEKDVKKAKGAYKQPTDYERTSLVLALIGKEPSNFTGYNLIEKIYSNKDIDEQGINAYIFALIALDSKDYKVPETAEWTRDKLIQSILKCRTKDNGWDFAGIKADPDMTAMAITALAPYKDRSDVKKAIDEGVERLSKMQNTDGTYTCYGVKNCESIAQVIIGLCANRVDPTSAEFTKNNKNLIDALMSFKTADGEFSHKQKENYDAKATEQALLALEAYKGLNTGNGLIYRFK